MESKLTQQIQPSEWHVLEVLRTLAEGDTGFQEYEIVELANYGRTMIIQGCIQSTEADEADYHEALIFPPAIIQGDVRRVLCFGGANGGILHRLSMLPNVEHVIQVDVDETLYYISRHYLPHMHAQRALPFRLDLHFTDPVGWLAANNSDLTNWADLIIADLPDSTRDSYASRLFTTRFYELIKSVLADNGVFITQAGQAHKQSAAFHNRVLASLKKVFPQVTNYCNFIPSYGLPWAFAMAGNRDANLHPENKILIERLRYIDSSKLTAYDLETHRHMFSLPLAFRKSLLDLSEIEENTLEYVEVALTQEQIKG